MFNRLDAIEEKYNELSFCFEKAEIKVVKEKYIYYYKGKYMN